MAKKRKKPKMDSVIIRCLPEVRSWLFWDRSGFRIMEMMWIIFIFIIIWRLVSVTKGMELWRFGEAKMRFSGREFTVIPPNYAHTTNSDLGTVSKWEYLFIDVEGLHEKISEQSGKG